MHLGFERRHLRCLPWPMLMPLCNSKEVLQIQGMVRWFSVIYGVTEKEPEKNKAPNKQTNNADNFHLFKTEPLSEANNLLSHLRRNDISFLFSCFARTAAGRREKLKEMKGTPRPLPVSSTVHLSLSKLKARLCFLPFVTGQKWSVAADLRRILSIPLSPT